jgi:GNAT superfamily N-acetyltransferase
VWEHDDDLAALLASRGYATSDRDGYELVADASLPAVAVLPDGFRMISLTPALNERYVALHRAAWSRPGRPSTYDREQHERVTAMPDFRYELVPIVAAADGSLAAYCMSWFDPRSRSVEIEPLGTHPDFRRRGLARAIVHEVRRRAAALGASSVLVWGSSELPDAKALYESAGHRSRRMLRDYRLRIEGAASL